MRAGLSLLLFVLLCFAVAALGGLATETGPGSWYDQLKKPVFQPPNWLFGPVWTLLYGLIAIAGWRIWMAPKTTERRAAMGLWGLQLGLNLLWSYLFFAWKQPGFAFVEILILWGVIGLFIFRARSVSSLASWLFLPYWAWVSFATLLNGSIWLLNR